MLPVDMVEGTEVPVYPNLEMTLRSQALIWVVEMDVDEETLLVPAE